MRHKQNKTFSFSHIFAQKIKQKSEHANSLTQLTILTAYIIKTTIWANIPTLEATKHVRIVGIL